MRRSFSESLFLAKLLILASILLPVLAWGEASSFTNLSALDPTPGANAAEPTLAVHPLNPNFMVAAAPYFGVPRSINVWIKRSSTSGWTLQQLGQSLDGQELNEGRVDNSVVIAPDGTICVVYLVNSSGCPADRDSRYIVCAKATAANDYQFISSNITVIDAGCGADKPFVTLKPTTNSFDLYVSYNFAKGGALRIIDLPNGGPSHSEMQVQNSGPVFSMPLVDQQNHKAYVLYDQGSGSITIQRSTDQWPLTFENPVTIENVGFGLETPIPNLAPIRGIHPGPYGAIDESSVHPGRIYVAYVMLDLSLPKQSEVAVRYSDDFGTTWSARHIVHRTAVSTSDRAFQFLPCIAVDKSTGVVCVFYLDSRNGMTDPDHQRTEPWVSVSTDGDVWSESRVYPMLTDESGTSGGAINYLEYQGVAIRNGIIRGVWAGDVQQLITPNPGQKDILFFELDSNPLFSHNTFDVPLQTPRVSDMLRTAKPGDTIEISGPITDSFTEVANIRVIPKPGVRPSIHASSGPAVKVPVWLNTEISGMDFVGSADTPIIDANMPPTDAVTNIQLDQCVLTTGSYGDTCISARNVGLSMWGCTVTTGVGGGDGLAIDLSNSALTLDNCAIYGFQNGINADGDAREITLSNSQIYSGDAGGVAINAGRSHITMDNCSLFLSNGSTGLALYRSKPTTGDVVSNSNFVGGAVGISSVFSYLQVLSSTFENQGAGQATGVGIQVGFYDPDNIVHTRIQDNVLSSTSLNGFGISVTGLKTSDQLPPTAEIQGNTVNGWATGILVEGAESSPEPLDPPHPPPGTSFAPVLTNNLVTDFQQLGVGSSGTAATVSCNDSYSAHGVAYNPVNSSGMSVDPLFCSSLLGSSLRDRFQLRIDSPIAVENRSTTDPCQGRIGALDAGCAYGNLSRNTTFSGTAKVLQDLVVQSGKVLQLKGGVTLKFDEQDETSGGTYGSKTELIVDGGTANIGETSGSVLLTSADGIPNANDWGGITVRNQGHLTIQGTTIEGCGTGVTVKADAAIGTTAAVTIRNSTTGVRVYGPSIATIRGLTTASVEEGVVLLAGSQADVRYSDLAGSKNGLGERLATTNLVQCTLTGGEKGLDMTGGSLTGSNSTFIGAFYDGVSAGTNATATFNSSQFKDSPIGLWVDSGSTVTLNNATVLNSETGIWARGSVVMPTGQVQNCPWGIWSDENGSLSIGSSGGVLAWTPAVTVSGNQTEGIGISSSASCSLERVAVIGTSSGYWKGIHVYPGSEAAIVDCQVSGAAGPATTGIWIEGPTDIAGTVVSNISKNTGGIGIYIDSDSSVVTLHETYNNLLGTTRRTEVNNARFGLDIEGSSRPKIRNSIISDNRSYCVRIGLAAMPDLGTWPEDPGNNSIHTIAISSGKLAGSPEELHADNSVKAQGNWWGNSTPPASQISTWVDYSHYLTSNPYAPSSFSGQNMVQMEALPGISRLKQGFPTPFSQAVSIPYSVGKQDQSVTIAVYDLSGRRVRLLVDDKVPQGDYETRWDGRQESGEIAPNGVYFLKARIGNVHASQRVVFIH